MEDFLAKARVRPAEVIKELWSERNFHLTIGLRSLHTYICGTRIRAHVCSRDTEYAYRERVRRRGCTAAIWEYYCCAGRSTTGEREIYQRAGVYVATNCRVNIHAIRGWPSPPFILLHHRFVSSFRARVDDVAKFSISTPTSLYFHPGSQLPRRNNSLAHILLRKIYYVIMKILITVVFSYRLFKFVL